MRKFFSFLFIVGTALGAYASINWFLWQHQAITAFLPVPARIISAEVKAHRSSKSTSYSADISYQYTYQGQSYKSNRVFPIDEEGDNSWARGIVNRYEPLIDFIGFEAAAPKATAYINPSNPSESILVREYSFTPYVLALVTLLGAAVSLGFFTRVLGSARTTMTAIALDTSDVRLLLPVKSLRSRAINAMAVFLGFAAATVPVLFHWIFIAGQLSHSVGAWFVHMAVAIFLIALLVLAVRRWSLSRHISDARLSVRPVPMVRGEPFDLDLESDAYAPLRVKEARVKLECIEHYRERRGNKTQYGTRTKHTLKAVLAGETQVPAGQVLAGKGSVTSNPDEGPPTSPDQKSYPYYTWQIRVEIDLDGAVDYAGIFPLDVA